MHTPDRIQVSEHEYGYDSVGEDNNGAETEASEPDLSSDDMGAGLGHEIPGPEEIVEVEDDARNEGPGGPPNPVEAPKQKRKRVPFKPRSKVWDWFTKVDEKADGSYVGKCNLCGKPFQRGNSIGTSSMAYHVKRGCRLIQLAKRKEKDPLQRMLQVNQKDGSNQQGQGGNGSPQSAVSVFKFDQVRSRKDFARMVITHEYPFKMANHHCLRVFLNNLQPEFKLVKRNTVRTDCMGVYEEEKAKLYGFLSKLNCRVSLTSDMWTSIKVDGFICITCHYIDDNWQIRKRILNFSYVPSPHKAVLLCEVIYKKLLAWNIDKKLCCIVLDNAATCDATVKELLKKPTLRNSLPFGGKLFHVRCSAHILNLVVHDGVVVMKYVIDKIRETMKYIRHSQQRLEDFRGVADQVNAPKVKVFYDVKTRWNSTYLMLEMALGYREAINRYAEFDKNYPFCPTPEDWDNAAILVQHLQIFYVATKKFSGTKYPTLNLFFSEFCEVHLSICGWLSSEHQFVRVMAKKMWDKFSKYWDICNALLAIASILDPRCKLITVEYYYTQLYFEAGQEYLGNVKSYLKMLFEEYLLKIPRTQAGPSQHGSSSSTSAIPPSNPAERRQGLTSLIQAKKVADPVKSELETYLDDPLDPNSWDDPHFEILAWWKLNASKYPVLASLVRDILAVPVSTVASESAFSTGGRVLDNVRAFLSTETIEALVCTQDWIKASISENGGEIGDSLLPTAEELEMLDEGVGGI